MKKEWNTGIDSWTHGQKRGGYQDWHVFLGPCPSCGKRTFDYGGGWRCVGEYCLNSVYNSAPNCGPAPEWWNQEVVLKKDGNMWCVHNYNFTNLMESPCGFGETPQEAYKQFKLELAKLRGEG